MALLTEKEVEQLRALLRSAYMDGYRRGRADEADGAAELDISRVEVAIGDEQDRSR